MNYPKVILFGDSLTESSFWIARGPWGAQVASSLARICDVLNRGFSGYTSRSLRYVFPSVFSAENLQDVKVFTLFVGANDFGGKEENDPAYVPIDEYSCNLENMINLLQELGLSKDKIILITPPPFHAEKFKKFCEEIERTFPTKTQERAAEYSAACTQVAKTCGVDFIDLHGEILKNEDWEEFLSDGVHLGGKGSAYLYELLQPEIEKRVCMTEKFQPHWSEINSKEPLNGKNGADNQI